MAAPVVDPVFKKLFLTFAQQHKTRLVQMKCLDIAVANGNTLEQAATGSLRQLKQQSPFLFWNQQELQTSLNHVFKMIAFAALGFSFAPWWQLMLGMAIAVIAGSWVGTRLRTRIPQRNFQRLFKTLVTLLALRMIALPFLS